MNYYQFVNEYFRTLININKFKEHGVKDHRWIALLNHYSKLREELYKYIGEF